MISEPPRCYDDGRYCKHFQGFVEDETGKDLVVCLAFPEGIPDSIAYGDDKHEKVVVGQVGVYVFEQEYARKQPGTTEQLFTPMRRLLPAYGQSKKKRKFRRTKGV